MLDDILMRTMDAVISLPTIILTLVVISMFGASNLVDSCAGHLDRAALRAAVRGAAVTVVERDFVGAAEALGEPRWRTSCRSCS